MAVSTTYSANHYKDTTNGVPFRLNSPPSGDDLKVETVAIPITQLDDALDFTAFFAILQDRLIKRLDVVGGDHDIHATPTLDQDVILRTVLEDGTVQDDILYNAGTAFTAAHDKTVLFPTEGASAVRVPRSKFGYGHVGLLVNVIAADPGVDVETTLAITHG